MSTTNPQFVTVEQAAEIIGCTGARIRQLLAEGKIRGRKFGRRVWLVPRTEVRRIKNATKVGPGRPRKKT